MDTSTIIGIVILILLIVGFVVFIVSTLPPPCVDISGVWIGGSDKAPATAPKVSLKFTKTNDAYMVELGQVGSTPAMQVPATVTCDGKISMQVYPNSNRIAMAEVVGSEIVLKEGSETFHLKKQ